MPTLKPHQIESMIEDLETINVWLRDLDRRDTHAHFITDPARVKVRTIKTALLRASLGEVEVEPAAREVIPAMPARRTEAVA
jgi:hypothetical protein